MYIGLIPARWDSTRFTGKPLANISGKSMIRRVYDQTLKSRLLNKVIVLTDDQRIQEECLKYSMEVMMIKEECHSGTDRVAIASKNLNADLYVNIQGDEPLINPDSIDGVLNNLINDNSVEVESMMARWKSLYSGELKSRDPQRQRVEVCLKAQMINKIIQDQAA